MHSSVSGAQAVDLPFAERFLRRRFKMGYRGVAEFAVTALVLVTADPSLRSLLVGGAVSLLGLSLRAFTAGYGFKADEIAVSGPYRFMRHPYFAGTALLYLGLCLAGRDAYVMAVALLLMTFVFRLDVNKRDARLARTLGPGFLAYRALVPAVVPRLYPEAAGGFWPTGARSASIERRFSLRLSLLRGRHRELDTVLGFSVCFLLLYLCYRVSAKDLFHFVVMITVALCIVGRFVYVAHFRHPLK